MVSVSIFKACRHLVKCLCTCSMRKGRVNPKRMQIYVIFVMAVITSVVNGSICRIYPTIQFSARRDGLVVMTSAVNGKVGIILKLTLIITL